MSEDLHEAVTWAYRLLLCREPESDSVIDDHVKTLPSRSFKAVRDRFVASNEFRSALRSHPSAATLSRATSSWEQFRDSGPYPREHGFFRDALGVRTRLSLLPPAYERFSRGLAGDGGLDFLPLHDDVELDTMAIAASEASGTFTVMELGAGWGPWVSMGARMALSRGIEYRLIAVEGSAEHFDFLRTHITDNDIDESRCRLLHGVVGATDGVSRFPKMVDPSADYGASSDWANTSTGEFEEVPSFSIASLVADEPLIDILHCDIQGHELDAMSASIDALSNRVRRVLVGTHGRTIEGGLHDLFAGNGWRLEQDVACRVAHSEHGPPTLMVDGAQSWTNVRLV